MNGSNLYQSYDKAMDRQRLEEEFERNAILLLNQQKQSRIDSFKGYFEFLSNNFLSPVYNEGILFPSVSHAFQACRTTDETTKKAILNAESLLIVGKIARRIEDPEDWNLKRLVIMEKLIRDKFRRSKELLEKLKATNPRELIMTYEEESPANLFWGCVKERGQNQLGRIIMKIRNDIMENDELLNWISNCFELITEINYLPEINLTVKKNGETIDHIILKNRPYYLFGNLSSNDLKLEHPSISRIHAAIICDRNNGVILLDLRSKSGTKLDGDLLQDHIPYKLKNGKKINFAMSTRDYFIDIDMTKIQRMYEKEKNKLEDDYELINKFKENNDDNIDKEMINKSFGLSVNKNDNIFVNHIPYEASDVQIKYLFEDQFGRIKNFRCPVDRDTGRKKGFAFIQFYDLKSAEEAVSYGIICFKEKDNIFLKIKFADPIPNWDSYNNNYREERSNIRRRSRSRSKSRSREDKRKRDKEKERKRNRRYSKERNGRSRSLSHSRKKYEKYERHEKYENKENKENQESNNDKNYNSRNKNDRELIKKKSNKSENQFDKGEEYNNNNKERNRDRDKDKDRDKYKYSSNKDKKRKRKISSISKNDSENESSSSYLSSSSSDNTEKLKSSSEENSDEDNSSSSESEYSRKK
jgi:ribA/ribD-fused uncharacterized protein